MTWTIAKAEAQQPKQRRNKPVLAVLFVALAQADLIPEEEWAGLIEAGVGLSLVGPGGESGAEAVPSDSAPKKPFRAPARFLQQHGRRKGDTVLAHPSVSCFGIPPLNPPGARGEAASLPLRAGEGSGWGFHTGWCPQSMANRRSTTLRPSLFIPVAAPTPPSTVRFRRPVPVKQK